MNTLGFKKAELLTSASNPLKEEEKVSSKSSGKKISLKAKVTLAKVKSPISKPEVSDEEELSSSLIAGKSGGKIKPSKKKVLPVSKTVKLDLLQQGLKRNLISNFTSVLS